MEWLEQRQLDHLSQQIKEQDPKRFIFKSIDTHAFKYYFQQGGIAPNPDDASDPNWQSLTRHWEDARRYSEDKSSYQTTRPYGVVVMEAADNQGTRGGYNFPWTDVKKIIVSQEGYEIIQVEYMAYARENTNPSITWEDLDRKIKTINWDNEVEFRKALLGSL